MEELLSTETYRTLKKDLTVAQEAKISHILRKYVKKDEISDELYNWLRLSVASHSGTMGWQRSIRRVYHSDPSFHASNPPHTDFPNTLPNLFLPLLVP